MKSINSIFKLHKSNLFGHSLTIMFILSWLCSAPATAQTQVMAWGNITGIRIEGQLMDFETSLQVAGRNWQSVNATGKERQSPTYHRTGDEQTVTTKLGSIAFKEVVTENGRGSAVVNITAEAMKDTTLEGVYFCVDLPATYYANAKVKLNGTASEKSVSSLTGREDKIHSMSVRQVEILGNQQQLTMKFPGKVTGFFRITDDHPRFYVQLMGSKIKKGANTTQQITLISSGEIDHSTAGISIDANKPGRLFAGFGGNFRLQNPKADPQVIQYCLNNMRVAWGRVELPWGMWQPEEHMNPIDSAKAGKLNKHVYQSMEMAQELTKKGIPVILSDWQAPDWAIVGEQQDAYRYRHLGIFGYLLKKEKMQQIYQSLADYLVYLKDEYGVEPALFSFNESDLGINVRMTGEEHATFIKEFGSYLASRGLTTKLLLGDNSDATTFDFIKPAMHDPQTYPYIGAISFHSWRGCDDATLKKWAGAAREMKLPLIVAEGSTDAAAYRYPDIFYEQTFALYEINLYIRICSISQPLSILQWQLTSDYSPLKGMGIFGTEGPLEPTRRFWNLKQLASTPAASYSLPVTCNKAEVNCAAFGNIARGEYAIHMVNNGAARKAVITGIPDGVKNLSVYVTDKEKGMEKIGEVPVKNGKVE
ncbi:MAG TPA: hypothetical protein VE870_17265, partial [Bacteroidales bacterium]|nr:hypothetical protein [Bacteroidales bacterium]